jgi:hypothetical protein
MENLKLIPNNLEGYGKLLIPDILPKWHYHHIHLIEYKLLARKKLRQLFLVTN